MTPFIPFSSFTDTFFLTLVTSLVAFDSADGGPAFVLATEIKYKLNIVDISQPQGCPVNSLYRLSITNNHQFSTKIFYLFFQELSSVNELILLCGWGTLGHPGLQHAKFKSNVMQIYK